MNKRKGAWIGALALGLNLMLAACVPVRPFGMMDRPERIVGREFDTNGEQIYFAATSHRDSSITFDMAGSGMMGNMPMMMGGTMTCADCHGPDGHGGRVQMMMSTFTAPDIRWETLIADHGHEEAEDNHGDEEMEHPPYSEETLKRAITEGVNPAEEPLAWPMPRWQMSDEDLDDLIGYLKTLE